MNHLDRMACEDTFRRLDDYIDRALTPAETELVEKHLQTCEMCAKEYRFEAALLQEVRRKLGRIRAPWGLTDRIMNSLAQAAREQ
jgi:anti-sigma factor (TIGR02949 family)